MENMDYKEPRPEAERLNDRGVEVARQAMSRLCTETIELVYAGIEAHLRADAENLKQVVVNDELGFFVQHDILTAPMFNGEFISTYCTRLEPDYLNGSADKYLEIHIPVTNEDISEFEMPAENTVTEVYVHVGGQEDHWYAITPEGVYEYVPRAEQDENFEGVLDDQGIWAGIYERIPEDMNRVTELFRRIVNWRTVPYLSHPNPEEPPRTT